MLAIFLKIEHTVLNILLENVFMVMISITVQLNPMEYNQIIMVIKTVKLNNMEIKMKYMVLVTITVDMTEKNQIMKIINTIQINKIWLIGDRSLSTNLYFSFPKIPFFWNHFFFY